MPEVVTFITSQGRMKYVRPLYRALRSSINGKDTAINTFKKYKNVYHPIARKMIEADLKKADDQNNNSSKESSQSKVSSSLSSSKIFSYTTGIIFLAAVSLTATILIKNSRR